MSRQIFYFKENLFITSVFKWFIPQISSSTLTSEFEKPNNKSIDYSLVIKIDCIAV